MAIKLSNLVKRQLPEFISNQYSTFSTFIEKYYEGLEIQGQPLDILSNITEYHDINFYEKNLITEFATLAQNLTINDQEIYLDDAYAFPEEYGYVKIGSEICFYTKKEGNVLTGVYRGVSGTTRLGDLYKASEYITTDSENHTAGVQVQNISNLFLFAILKSFESQYLASIPKKYLSQSIDKKTLIKNITDFYKSKGSEKSIKFIFNSLVSPENKDITEVIRPSERTLKASTSDWVKNYSIKAKLISGNSNNLLNQTIDDLRPTASAVIDSVKNISENLILGIDPTSIVGNFEIAAETELVSAMSSNANQTIEVVSTRGWKLTNNKLYIGNEEVEIESRTVNQFVIKSRTGSNTYSAGTKIYSRKPLSVNGVKFVITGNVYNITPATKNPYSRVGDPILESQNVNDSKDVVVFDSLSGDYRWIGNPSRNSPTISTYPSLQGSVDTLNANVSALFEDENYFYVCSSGYPQFDILDIPDVTGNLDKNSYLKLIRKTPLTTTDIYKTGFDDIGIFVDGTIAYGRKSRTSVKTGKIENVRIISKGFGYKKPPYVLVNNSPTKARAILSGQVVSDIEILTDQVYRRTPNVVITSGRNGEVSANVTNGEITSLVIVNPGEFYTSPPQIRITDNLGRGRFAEYESIISNSGNLIGFRKINGGRNYSQGNVKVEVISAGSGAAAEFDIKEWYYNRYQELNFIDDNGGTLIRKRFVEQKDTYAVVSNPRRLRKLIGDNINPTTLEENVTGHSKILGYAYDGNPIYGPYGYENPLDAQSSISRMKSGYTLKTLRRDGPFTTVYPLGTFEEDYEWNPNIDQTYLDANNGRYCVTPEYPNGTYAYFVTIENDGTPVYPYIIGQNYYSLPVDSNYNTELTQTELPRSSKQLSFSDFDENGSNFSAVVTDIDPGTIDSVYVGETVTKHSPGNLIYIDNSNVRGVDAKCAVSEVFGEEVSELSSKQSIVNLLSTNSVYLLKDYLLKQRVTNITGSVVGDVLFDTNIFLESVSQPFVSGNNFDLIDPNTNNVVKILSIVLTKNSSFTAGAILSLTDGRTDANSVKATGRILETTSVQNSVRVLVLSGDFDLGIGNSTLTLQSSNVSDTPGSQVIANVSLSENIEISTIDYNFALVKTENDHLLRTRDFVEIEINPDDAVTEKTYYVRKRLFQELQLRDRVLNGSLIDTGIGSVSILTGGLFDTAGTFTVVVDSATLNVTITEYTDPDSNVYYSVSNIEIVDKGSGFEEGNILTLNNITGLPESTYQARLQQGISRPSLFRVDHAGLAENQTEMKLSNVDNIGIGDLLRIENEIVSVTSVNSQQRLVGITRGVNGTIATKHFNRVSVEFENFVYRFTPGQPILELGTDPDSPVVYTYDEDTNRLVLVYEYGISQSRNISVSTFIRDESSPNKKSVDIEKVFDAAFKLEFSEDDENNFETNPTIEAQLYYKYRFDTSHFSMSDTFLDFSPSVNLNIVTQEKIVGTEQPGTAGAFVSLKFGFGPSIATNTYTKTEILKFSNYYYFNVSGNVDTENARISVVGDPLTGRKTIEYITNNKFIYKISKQPQENGSGVITYSTNSSNAQGLIKSVKIQNKGKDYIDVPSVLGVETPSSRSAVVEPVINESGSLIGFKINNQGSGYVKPVLYIEGDGNPGIFQVLVDEGKIFSINVSKPGTNYTTIPKISLIESANKIFINSSSIGLPRAIGIVNPGIGYTSNFSTLPNFTSTYAVILDNIEDRSEFSPGKLITQSDNNGNIIFSGNVVPAPIIREGTNVVRLLNVVGTPSKEYTFGGSNILDVIKTDYSAEYQSYFDKNGTYKSNKGIIGSDSKITDSYFYQDYSYVIKSKTPIDLWRDLIKDVVHPAGFQLFGEVVVEAKVGALEQPVEQQSASVNVGIASAGLSDVFTFSKTIQFTEIVETGAPTDVLRGVGRLALNEQSVETTRVKDVYFAPTFDGYVDGDTGKIFGTKSFVIYDVRTNNPISPYNECAILVSLNGVTQEPKKSYTISGSTITFDTAPLAGSTLVAKTFDFVDDPTKNERFFKKAKNIFQRNGIWLDAANQVRSNKQFIVDETIGYIEEKYPSTTYDRAKCVRDIGFIVDAFEHDLRFGGNSKTILSGEFYYNAANELDFINNELEETREAYLYAAKLCAAAIRNWDISFTEQVELSNTSDIITVPSTFGLVEGMFVSSGGQFPMGTKITEIISDTQVRVSANPFYQVESGAPNLLTVPSGDLVSLGDNEYLFNGLLIEGDLVIESSTTVTIEVFLLRLQQVTFSLSRLNSGTFVDAANLIQANKNYIANETISWLNITYPGFSNPSEGKCKRDIGYLIDAVVYNLTFGGNNKLVEYAEKYYNGNRLDFVDSELTETLAAFEYATELMKTAVQNPGAPFETVGYPVAPDQANPLDLCAPVRSAIDTYYNLYEYILQNGTNLVEKDFGNTQKAGEYTSILTYSNYSILDDANMLGVSNIGGRDFQSECAEVVSALYTLHQSLDTILTTGVGSVDVSAPDYFNNENTTFDLYEDNGDILKTTSQENLLVFINGVLQLPSAYKIIRSEDPLETDKIEFSSAPKWDQNEAQLLLQEGLSVDTFFAFSIGEFKRLVVDERFLPFEKRVYIRDGNQPINALVDSRFLSVYVDNVLQKEGKDYRIVGNKINFNRKLNTFTDVTGILKTQVVDIISFLGESNVTGFNAFDFEYDAYADYGYFDFFVSEDFYNEFVLWNGPASDSAILLYNDDKFIAEIFKFHIITEPFQGIRFYFRNNTNPTINTDGQLIFKKGVNQQPYGEIVADLNVVISENTTYFAPDTYVFGSIEILDGVEVTIENTATVISTDIVFQYNTDDSSERVMRRKGGLHFANFQIRNESWRINNKLTANILEGDQIKIDGESQFRKVLSVPDVVKSTQFNNDVSNRNSFYGLLETTFEGEFPPGAGLSVIPILDEQGKVASLDLNKPDFIRYALLNLPTGSIGSGYVRDVYIDFIPRDGNGGGAKAEVIIWGKEVVSVNILDPGFGYTQPPIALISRGYDIIRSQRNVISRTERIVSPEFEVGVISSVSEIFVGDAVEIGGVIEPIATQVFVPEPQISEDVVNVIVQPPAIDVSDVEASGTEELNILFVDYSLPQVEEKETLFIRPLQSISNVGEAVETGGEIQYFTEQDVGAGDTLIVPEQLNLVETAINIQAEPGDLIIFVVSTNNFLDEGQLLIGGREVVNYSSKLEDRFIIDPGNRGQLGTDAEQWLVGTIVQPFVDNISINVGRFEIIENELDVSGEYSVISESTTLVTTNEESQSGDVNVLSVTEEDILSRFVETDIINNAIDIEASVLRFVSEESIEILVDQPISIFDITIFNGSESTETLDISLQETDVFNSVYPVAINSDLQAAIGSVNLQIQSDPDEIVGLVGISESSFTILSDPEEEVIDVALAFVGMESISDQITLGNIESTSEFNIVDATSSATLFNEIAADVTILTVQTSTDYVDVTPVVEAEPLDVSLVYTGIESISDEIVALAQPAVETVSLSATEINADIKLLVSSEDTSVGVQTIQSISDVTEVEQVVEDSTPSDVSFIDVSILVLDGQITLAPVDSESVFVFTALDAQGINNILELGEYNVDMVVGESESTMVVDEPKEEEISDVSLIDSGIQGISDEILGSLQIVRDDLTLFFSDTQIVNNILELGEYNVDIVGAESESTMVVDEPKEEEISDVSLVNTGIESISDEIVNSLEIVRDDLTSFFINIQIDAQIVNNTLEIDEYNIDMVGAESESTMVVDEPEEEEIPDVSLIDSGIQGISDEIVNSLEIVRDDLTLFFSNTQIVNNILELGEYNVDMVGGESESTIITDEPKEEEIPDVSLIDSGIQGISDEIVNSLEIVRDDLTLFFSNTQITQIVNNILEIDAYNVDMVGGESESTVVVDEPKEEEISDVSLITIGLEISDEVISIAEPETIEIGASTGLSQELLKVPEDIGLASSAESSALLVTFTQIDSIVDTDEREVVAPEHQDTQIDTTIDNGAIDEFIEIDTIQIDLN